MKLSYRYTVAYAVITLVVLSIGFAIVSYSINRNAVQALAGKLERLNQLVSAQARSAGIDRYRSLRRNVVISPLPPGARAVPAEGRLVVRKEWNTELQTDVTGLYVSTPLTSEGRPFTITSKAVLIEPDAIYLNGLILVFAWTFVFLMALVVVLSEVLSWYVLRPFYATLAGMQQFSLNHEQPIDIADTQTYEFNELNTFVAKMAHKAKGDYRALQEFTENASHELQTPLATIKAKIELLVETPLEEFQLKTISEMHNEIERLSRINSALILLAKLEHHELRTNSRVNVSVDLQETISRFADWLEMKHIVLHKQIANDVYIHLDASLTQILLTNLISNAIRHNELHGELRVVLSADELCIYNTGAPPSVPVEELFSRFKRGNSNLDSIGLGLSIVKKICTLYNHTIAYSYSAGIHCIRVAFAPAVDL